MAALDRAASGHVVARPPLAAAPARSAAVGPRQRRDATRSGAGGRACDLHAGAALAAHDASAPGAHRLASPTAAAGAAGGTGSARTHAVAPALPAAPDNPAPTYDERLERALAPAGGMDTAGRVGARQAVARHQAWRRLRPLGPRAARRDAGRRSDALRRRGARQRPPIRTLSLLARSLSCRAGGCAR